MNMDLKNLKDHPERESGFTPEFRELLRSCDPSPELMSWNQVVSLVESAPPVRVPWYMEILSANQRQLRFAAAPLLVLVLIGGMWVMPAQSLNIGTTVISNLPGDWSYNSPQFQELNTVSRSSFDELALPQTNMQLMVMPEGASQKLVMVLSGLDEAQTANFYGKLQERFPALAAMEHELYPIETKKHENLLADMTAKIGGMKQVEGLSDNQLKLHVKDILDEAGFTNVKLTVSRSTGGKVLIDVEADFDAKGNQSELSISDFHDAGYDRDTLGSETYEILLEEFGVDTH
jgi:hypothetical protein